MEQRTRLKIAALALTCATLCSCGSSKNDITYFQDIDQIPIEEWNKTMDPSPKLQKSDELSIIVNAVDQTAVSAFNKPAYTPFLPQNPTMNTQPQIQLYRIDANGDIDFPVLGKIHVDGMNVQELTDLLTQRIAVYAQDPIVTVELTSFSVTVMGEVAHPGLSYFGGNRGTILEALSMRGDLTVYGDRTDVLLIRENSDGKREYHHIDLTSAEVLNSPYFYMKQHDIIYVSPNHARRSSSNYNNLKQQNLSMVSTIVSVVSVLTSLSIAIFK